MKWLSTVYNKTTNPREGYEVLLSLDVLLSIVIHIAIYLLFIYMLQISTNINIIVKQQWLSAAGFLFIIMCIGYLGRLCRAKCIYEVEMEKKQEEEEAIKNTNEIMDKGYFTWYFLG